jgi:hypothetical protein
MNPARLGLPRTPARAFAVSDVVPSLQHRLVRAVEPIPILHGDAADRFADGVLDDADAQRQQLAIELTGDQPLPRRSISSLPAGRRIKRVRQLGFEEILIARNSARSRRSSVCAISLSGSTFRQRCSPALRAGAFTPPWRRSCSGPNTAEFRHWVSHPLRERLARSERAVTGCLHEPDG